MVRGNPRQDTGKNGGNEERRQRQRLTLQQFSGATHLTPQESAACPIAGFSPKGATRLPQAATARGTDPRPAPRNSTIQVSADASRPLPVCRGPGASTLGWGPSDAPGLVSSTRCPRQPSTDPNSRSNVALRFAWRQVGFGRCAGGTSPGATGPGAAGSRRACGRRQSRGAPCGSARTQPGTWTSARFPPPRPTRPSASPGWQFAETPDRRCGADPIASAAGQSPHRTAGRSRGSGTTGHSAPDGARKGQRAAGPARQAVCCQRVTGRRPRTLRVPIPGRRTGGEGGSKVATKSQDRSTTCAAEGSGIARSGGRSRGTDSRRSIPAPACRSLVVRGSGRSAAVGLRTGGCNEGNNRAACHWIHEHQSLAVRLRRTAIGPVKLIDREGTGAAGEETG